MTENWWRDAYADFCEDRQRYPRGAWISEPGLIVTAIYRIGQASLCAPRPWRWLVAGFYIVSATAVRWITHMEIPRAATIGPGLRIHHAGPLSVHARAVLGARVILRTGVVIGHAGTEDAVPVIGDDVEFGANSVVIGRVAIGDRARIGALTLVNFDVPPDARVVGQRARILATQ